MEREEKVILPKIGESLYSATILRWHKNEGEWINKDEALLEVTTDKVATEIPSPFSGTVKRILAAEGKEVSVGDELALISLSQEKKEKTEEFLSPAVVSFAKENNLSMEEIAKIPREKDRLTRKDIEKYLENKMHRDPGQERVKMSFLRKAVSDTMKKSYDEIPQASVFAEVDVTDALEIIAENKDSFLKKHGAKLSFTSFVARAIALGCSEYPLVSSSVDYDEIIIRKEINLGIAVGVEGGVLVPVVRQAEKKTIGVLAKEIFTLAAKAREGSLTNEDMSSGTVTVTNFGMSGIWMGVPIIRYPEAAIIGIGGIQKKPVVVAGDKIGIRSIVVISVTFDHRIFDGMYACSFLQKVKYFLEQRDYERELETTF